MNYYQLYADDLYRASSSGLSELVDIIFSWLENKQFDNFDELFKGVDVTRLAPEYLLGFLRFPFTYRKLITEWVPFRDIVRDELKSRHMDDNLLQGLF